MLKGKSLKSIVSVLESFAPLECAEKWDNVGLLIEPCSPKLIKKILFTNDLTEPVMLEAVARETDLIVSYHPPIFAPLKRITQGHWKQRIVSLCISKDIAVYSPHTAWDSALGGVNDWLSSALPHTDVKPIQPNPIIPETGTGRIFNVSITLAQAIRKVQDHIGLCVHVGLGAGHNMTSTTLNKVAVCAGSGGSVLKGVCADLFITGEMSHHEVLEANHQGTSVILCNHSNSERGFLKTFQPKLEEMLDNECVVMLSEKDEDPLKTYHMQVNCERVH